MLPVRIHDSNSAPWQRFSDLIPQDMAHHFSDKELSSTIFMHESGDADSLQLSEVRYNPGVVIEPHAHEQDEIFYVIAGEIRLGNRALGPGHSFFVKGQTVYSFQVGPQGAHFLAFRPRKDLSYIPREQWEASRAQPSGRDA